jgi:hypothetical protein
MWESKSPLPSIFYLLPSEIAANCKYFCPDDMKDFCIGK